MIQPRDFILQYILHRVGQIDTNAETNVKVRTLQFKQLALEGLLAYVVVRDLEIPSKK